MVMLYVFAVDLRVSVVVCASDTAVYLRIQPAVAADAFVALVTIGIVTSMNHTSVRYHDNTRVTRLHVPTSDMHNTPDLASPSPLPPAPLTTTRGGLWKVL